MFFILGTYPFEFAFLGSVIFLRPALPAQHVQYTERGAQEGLFWLLQRLTGKGTLELEQVFSKRFA